MQLHEKAEGGGATDPMTGADAAFLSDIEQQYTTEEQRRNHSGTQPAQAAPQEVVFF
jgi:hypothetical protein